MVISLQAALTGAVLGAARPREAFRREQMVVPET
jgi:hypothetical protein